MKRVEVLLAPLAAVAFATVPIAATAQSKSEPSTPSSTQGSMTGAPSAAKPSPAPKSTMAPAASDPSPHMTGKSMSEWERSHRASKIIGTDVRNSKGEKIGDVKDIVLDKNGGVAYAVVSTGGFLGIGDRLHAVPWQSLQMNASGKDHYILDIDKARLSKVPGFSSKSWPNFADDRWDSENRKYYQEK